MLKPDERSSLFTIHPCNLANDMLERRTYPMEKKISYLAALVQSSSLWGWLWGRMWNIGARVYSPLLLKKVTWSAGWVRCCVCVGNWASLRTLWLHLRFPSAQPFVTSVQQLHRDSPVLESEDLPTGYLSQAWGTTPTKCTPILAKYY